MEKSEPGSANENRIDHDKLWEKKEEFRQSMSCHDSEIFWEIPGIETELSKFPNIQGVKDLGIFEFVDGSWQFLRRAPYTIGDFFLRDEFTIEKGLVSNWREAKREELEKEVKYWNRSLDQFLNSIESAIRINETHLNKVWLKELENIGAKTPSEARTIHPDRIVRVNDLLGRKKEPVHILIENLLAKGWIGLLAGASKSYKSWLSLDLALAVSTGSQWLGFQCGRGRVLYVDYELSHSSITSRLRKLSKSEAGPRYGPDFLVLGDNSIEKNQIALILDEIGRIKGEKEKAGYTYSQGDSHNSRFRPKRVKLIDSKKDIYGGIYDLIIIDPLYMLLNGRDENSATEMVDVFKEIRALRQATGAAILINTHFRKGPKDWRTSSSDRISGSGVFTRYPSLIMTLNRVADGLSIKKQREVKNNYVLEFTLRHLKTPNPLGLKLNEEECRFSLLRKEDTDIDLQVGPSSGRGRSNKSDKKIERFLRKHYSNLNGKPPAETIKYMLDHNIDVSRATIYRFFQSNQYVITTKSGEKIVTLPFAPRNEERV